MTGDAGAECKLGLTIVQWSRGVVVTELVSINSGPSYYLDG